MYSSICRALIRCQGISSSNKPLYRSFCEGAAAKMMLTSSCVLSSSSIAVRTSSAATRPICSRVGNVSTLRLSTFFSIFFVNLLCCLCRCKIIVYYSTIYHGKANVDLIVKDNQIRILTFFYRTFLISYFHDTCRVQADHTYNLFQGHITQSQHGADQSISCSHTPCKS